MKLAPGSSRFMADVPVRDDAALVLERMIYALKLARRGLAPRATTLQRATAISAVDSVLKGLK